MTIEVKVGGAWKSVTAPSVKVAGTWKAITHAWQNVAGEWKLFYGTIVPPPPPFNVVMQNSVVSGSRSNAGSCTSSAAVAIVTGGEAPVTGAWSKVSGITLTVTSPTSTSTTFSSSLTNGQTKSAVYRYTATDNLGNQAYADVTVNLVSTYVAPPPPLTVNVSPGSLSGYVSGAGSAFTGSTTASVSGGSGNYSYSWSAYASGVGVSSYPAGNSCSFGATIPANSSWSGSFAVTVTDNDSGASGSAGGSLNFYASA